MIPVLRKRAFLSDSFLSDSAPPSRSDGTNYFFGPVGFGRVVFWSSCFLVQLSFGPDVFSRHVVVELSFSRVVIHSQYGGSRNGNMG
jgi:hypothetical protein